MPPREAASLGPAVTGRLGPPSPSTRRGRAAPLAVAGRTARAETAVLGGRNPGRALQRRPARGGEVLVGRGARLAPARRDHRLPPSGPAPGVIAGDVLPVGPEPGDPDDRPPDMVARRPAPDGGSSSWRCGRCTLCSERIRSSSGEPQAFELVQHAGGNRNGCCSTHRSGSVYSQFHFEIVIICSSSGLLEGK